VDAIFKNMDLRDNIPKRLKQHVAYADDTLLTTRTRQVSVKTSYN
jgi:hypothetical protein